MSYEKFWDLTFYEVMLHVEAYNKKHEDMMYIAAWIVSHIKNHFNFSKKSSLTTPDKLLGKSRKITNLKDI